MIASLADKDTVLKLHNEALATEIVCTLLYRRHYFMADGLLESILAVEEEHADKLRSMLQDVSAHFGSRSAPGHRV